MSLNFRLWSKIFPFCGLVYKIPGNKNITAMLYSYIFALLLHIFAFICKLGVRNIDSKHKLCKKMNVMSCVIF